MLREFKMDYNTSKATKNICCGKCEDAVDKNTVTRWSKKLYTGCKTFNTPGEEGLKKWIPRLYLVFGSWLGFMACQPL